MRTSLLLPLFSCLFVSSLLQAQCVSYPTLELGNDTILCSGQSLTLQVPGFDTYNWSNGAVGNTVNISTPGTISLEVMGIGPNLVVNGDFEAGNSGFTSAYSYGSGGPWGLLSSEGQYAISTSPNLVHNNFSACSDHTPSGPGNMLIANGSGTPNTSVWCQTINVTPNTNYLFSAWISNALNDPNVSNLQFFVNDIQIGNVFATSAIACDWQEFNDTWNSGANTTAQLCIRNQNTSTGGNDFCLDDITFREVCVQQDTITISYDPLTVSIQNDIQFCENETGSFSASASVPNTQLIWETGDLGPSYTPATSGTYTVHAISANGCYVSDSAVATIIAMPWDIDAILVGPTSCGANDGYVSVMTNGTFNDPPIYTWSGPGQGSPNQINASVWTGRGVGWYYLSIESDGCYLYDSAQITPLNPPVAAFSADVTDGCSPLNVTFTNTSQNIGTCNWTFGNGQTASLGDLSSQTQTYTASGTAQLIVVQGQCSDTATVGITVSVCGCTDPSALNYDPNATVNDGTCIYPIPPNPTVETYNVFTPDASGENDLFFLTTTNTSNIDLTIINRWGTLMYEASGANPAWDGKVNGVDAAEGVYFYKYKVTGISGEVLEGHGFFELIR